MWNITTVVLYLFEKAFELFSIIFRSSVDDCFNFIRVGSKVIAADNVFEIFDKRIYEHIAFVLYSRLTQG